MGKDSTPVWEQIEELVDKMEMVYSLIHTLAKMTSIEGTSILFDASDINNVLWLATDLMKDILKKSDAVMEYAQKREVPEPEKVKA